MIGQVKLKNRIDNLVMNGFPGFAIICGASGSGKKLIANYIADKLNAQLVLSGIKVDEVREVINLSYKQSEPTLYLLPDCDKMSNAAKNALLKVTEEPPRKSYFVMTINDMINTLATLRSRGQVFNIDLYSPDELMDYASLKNYDFSNQEAFILQNICLVPGEVDLLSTYDIVSFYDFVQNVINNIGVVNGANAFKIGQKLKYKEGDEGWDILLFLRTLMLSYNERMIKNPKRKYVDCIRIICKYANQLRNNSINKSSTIDMMILELRGLED